MADMGNRTCAKCGKSLRSDNRSGYCYKCRAYAKLTPYGKQANCDRSRKNHAEFRRKLAAIKLERGCVDCGYSQYPEALDFDHLPGVEKFKAVALMWGFSWDKVLAEIAKCEIVCANCHRHRTAVRSESAKAVAAQAGIGAQPLTPRMPPLSPCGTYAAWARHKRRGEAVDQACIQAARDYKSAQMAAIRASRRATRSPSAAEAKIAPRRPPRAIGARSTIAATG